MSIARVVFFLILTGSVAACGSREPEQVGPQASRDNEAAPPPLKGPLPVIVRSPSYRCDDGGALYISVINDESYVTVRDRLADVPVRLDRNGDGGRYEGQDRTLSGVGPTVRYSGPQRPEQECREAEA